MPKTLIVPDNFLEDNSLEDDSLDSVKGWCKGCFARSGHRHFKVLVDKKYCQECFSLFSYSPKLQTQSKLEALSSPLGNSEPQPEKAAKIRQIIELINRTEESNSQTIRQGLIDIDELGGFSILGYESDGDFLKSEFPGLSRGYLAKVRTVGRIEKLVEVPLGTYTIDDLHPLFQFRIVVSVGQQERKGSKFVKTQRATGSKANKKGIALLKQTWAIAQAIGGQIPNRSQIREAVERMVDLGLAKSRKPRRSRESWKTKCIQLQQEIEVLRAECDRLREKLGVLVKNFNVP